MSSFEPSPTDHLRLLTVQPTDKTLDHRRPILQQPDYGVFRWWPQRGESWVHPYDIGIVRQMIPGNRVFRRQELDGQYLLVTYGAISFRIRPTLWYPVDHEGFDLGDRVEIKSRMGKTMPFVGQIREMTWDHHNKTIEYHVLRAGKNQARTYVAEELTLISSIQQTTEESSRRQA